MQIFINDEQDEIKLKQDINEFNKYNQNFYDGGRFCRCHAPYDAERERETMVQCLVCEDWQVFFYPAQRLGD